MANANRPTRTGLTDVQAECKGCGWTANTRNALGLAAIHHDATGHEVQTDVTRVVIYGDSPSPEELGQTSLLPEGSA